VGIALDDDWAGSKVVNNSITRAGGAWPGDSTTQFVGIHEGAATGPGTIESNTIVQTAPAPPKGFGFCGFNITASAPHSVMRLNVVRSSTATRFGTGIISEGTRLNQSTFEQNRFENLARESN